MKNVCLSTLSKYNTDDKNNSKHKIKIAKFSGDRKNNYKPSFLKSPIIKKRLFGLSTNLKLKNKKKFTSELNSIKVIKLSTSPSFKGNTQNFFCSEQKFFYSPTMTPFKEHCSKINYIKKKKNYNCKIDNSTNLILKLKELKEIKNKRKINFFKFNQEKNNKNKSTSFENKSTNCNNTYNNLTSRHENTKEINQKEKNHNNKNLNTNKRTPIKKIEIQLDNNFKCNNNKCLYNQFSAENILNKGKDKKLFTYSFLKDIKERKFSDFIDCLDYSRIKKRNKTQSQDKKTIVNNSSYFGKSQKEKIKKKYIHEKKMRGALEYGKIIDSQRKKNNDGYINNYFYHFILNNAKKENKNEEIDNDGPLSEKRMKLKIMNSPDSFLYYIYYCIKRGLKYKEPRIFLSKMKMRDKFRYYKKDLEGLEQKANFEVFNLKKQRAIGSDARLKGRIISTNTFLDLAFG